MSRYKYDLFISYAAVDDEPIGGLEGWVTKLVADLSIHLSTIIGRSPSIRFHRYNMVPLLGRTTLGNRSRVHENSLQSDETQQALRDSALLGSISSPAFLADERCLDELWTFVKEWGSARVVQIARMPVGTSLPVPGLIEHKFYRIASNRLPQELDGAMYRYALTELAQQIALLLRGLAGPDPKTAHLFRPMVFLCHSSGDKPSVRILSEKLKADGFDPWLDEERLKPALDWEWQIQEAIDRADAIVVCLSNSSICREGFVQREIKLVVDKAAEKPDETIFLIPARLEECTIPPSLGKKQWVNLFEDSGYAKLLQALQTRAASLDRQNHS